MKEWNCNNCGRQLESELEPEKCPCGNQNLESQEQLSMLEQMMKDYLNRENKNKGKS
jgi:ABC-type ATPase with predicted acetyltransferase domain